MSLDFAAIDEDSEAGSADWGRILEKAQGKDITEILDIEKDVKPLVRSMPQIRKVCRRCLEKPHYGHFTLHIFGMKASYFSN